LRRSSRFSSNVWRYRGSGGANRQSRHRGTIFVRRFTTAIITIAIITTDTITIAIIVTVGGAMAIVIAVGGKERRAVKRLVSYRLTLFSRPKSPLSFSEDGARASNRNTH
jgi:hypothetical protein